MPFPDFKSTPIVIVCRDRLAPLEQLLEWLDRAGYVRPILLDNASTFPPLADFLNRTDVEVVRLGENLGHLAPWVSEEAQAILDPDAPFVVTDCDVVPDRGCPDDVVERLARLLLRYADVDKVGLGLRIDDLPGSYALKDEVQAWEARFWETEKAPGVFDAEVDTTFALYRSPVVPHSTVRALRTGPPYVARHLSWYVDSANPTAEQRYYQEHADRSTTHWDAGRPDEGLQALLRLRADEVSTREIVTGSDNPLLQAWLAEPSLEDESQYTPWADRGWPAWNDMSPELAFCEFASALMLLLQPELVIETGVGQGFVTRRLAARLGAGQRLLAFEDDEETKRELERLPFFSSPRCAIGASASPTAADLARAELTILDSEAPTRIRELDLWAESAPPGAMVLIHDTGNGHGAETMHRMIRGEIEARKVPGVFLRNPRGSFLGFKPALVGPESGSTAD